MDRGFILMDATGKVIDNGWVTNAFKIERGIRQGCPLSALLFVLVVEVMVSRVRSNMTIQVISMMSYQFPKSHIRMTYVFHSYS